MILNHYYSIINFLFVLVFSFLMGKSFDPSELEFKENLIYNDNSREYHVLYNKELNYKFTGPIRLEIIARRAIPEKSKRKYEFGYIIKLENSDPINVMHKKYKKKNMISNIHPGHGYTQSGNTILNLPSGEHELKIVPMHKGKPTLIRIIKESYQRTEGVSEVVLPVSDNNNDLIMEHFIIKNNKRKYFQLENNHILSLFGKKDEMLSIYGRTNDFSNNSRYSFYQMEVQVDGKQKNIVIDCFLDNKIDTKRKIYHLINNDKSEIKFKLIDSNVPAYLRMIKNIPYE
tara:strand:- start:500 stop:1360 length:861 start_codon:yes stop_codon:yes gene_type:complete